MGGSTCCGKSSMAEILTAGWGLTYFKLDDFLDTYMEELAEAGNALCLKVAALDMPGMWMRDPGELFREELQIYRDMFPLALRDLAALPGDGPVLAEGAGFLPELMRETGVDSRHYLCVTPTREFQMEKYAQREWIREYLKGCSEPLQAFSNWMARDILFAKAARREAKRLGYSTILVNGRRSIEQNAAKAAGVFGLAERR